ncbi:MAG: DciA family protein [Planctomycetes bacterium]|nr:DciA family protein [Planctomycetota bacterium]
MNLLEHKLQKLGQWRAWREPDRSIGKDCSLMAKQLVRTEKSIGAASDAWMQLAPLGLQQVAAVESLRGGTLTLMVESSAAAFEVDRSLREGLQSDLMNAVPGLLRVRTRVGKFQEV